MALKAWADINIDPIEELSVNDFWPNSSKRYSTLKLRLLSDESFAILCGLVARRARRTGTEKEGIKRLIRRLRRHRWPYSTKKERKLYRGKTYKADHWLDALYPEREARWRPAHIRMAKGNSVSVDLNNFSFLDNPAGTLEMLRRVVVAECVAIKSRVNFEDKQVLDISPYMVWGLLAKSMFPFLSGGNIHTTVQAVIEATELRDFMNMNKFNLDGSERNISAFPLRRRRKIGKSEDQEIALHASTTEKVSDDVVEKINSWLSNIKRELTANGKSYIAKLVGEMLDNAERHGRLEGDGDWAVAGFMERRDVVDGNGFSQEILFCNLAFVNDGLSIGETISKAEEVSTREQLAEYIARHEKAPGQTRSTLELVFAVQDGISRKSQADGKKGGVGFMDAIDMINSLGSLSSADKRLEPRLVIVSGDACVIFAGPYRNNQKVNGIRLQWFNPGNSSAVPPSNSCVLPLPYKVPGTIISARFALAPSLVEKESNNDGS